MKYGLAWFESAYDGRTDSTAVSDERGSISAGELGARARAVASALIGDAPAIVGIELETGCDWWVAVQGAWLAGAAVLPIDLNADAELLQARRSRCDVVITAGLPEADVVTDLPGPNPLAPAAVLYTSGTTSTAREVMLSHGNLIAQGVASRAALAGTYADRWLSSLPMNHTGGLTVPVRSAVWGGEAMLRARFDAPEFVSLLTDPEERVTLVSLVPTMLSRLLDAGLDGSAQLRRAVVSGAPLAAQLKRSALDLGLPIVEAWGMTETTGMASVEREPGAGGAGVALDGIHIELGESGEVRVGGPTVAPGVMVGGMFDTGDLGHFESGSLVVDGRSSSIIISGGHNVSPERVERILGEHPSVSACLVRGIPDAEWGELVVADIVASAAVEDDELIEFCRQRMSAWEVPRRFKRVEQLRLTESGKPSRAVHHEP